MYPEIKTKVVKNLGVLTLEPENNALSVDFLKALAGEYVEMANTSGTDATMLMMKRMIVGMDIKAILAFMESRDREHVDEFLSFVHRDLITAFAESGKPVIAALQGSHILGGGLELVLPCHIIADKATSIGLVESGIGLFPGYMGIFSMMKRIGVRKTLEHVLAGDFIPAHRAFEEGIIDCIADTDFSNTVFAFAADVLEGRFVKQSHILIPEEANSLSEEEILRLANGKPAELVQAIIDAVRAIASRPTSVEASLAERERFLDVFFSRYAGEFVLAFLEGKRKPKWDNVIGGNKNIAASVEVLPSVVAEIPPWEKEEFSDARTAVREFVKERILANEKDLQTDTAAITEILQHMHECGATGSKFPEDKLTEIQRALRKAMETNEPLVKKIVSEMFDLGFFSVQFAEQYGGMGMGMVGACMVAQEIAYGDPAIGIIVGAHACLFSGPIAAYGTEDQKERYLVPGMRGEFLGGLASTEPHGGSNPAGKQALALKVSGGWEITGRYSFISNGRTARYLLVYAQTDKDALEDEALAKRTMGAFIVDTKSPGFLAYPDEDKGGLLASCTNGLSLDSVFVPEKDVLSIGVGNSEGYKTMMETFNCGRIMLAAANVGGIQAGIDEVLKFATTRMIGGGRKMYESESILEEIGNMRERLEVLKRAVYATAWEADRGMDIRVSAAAVKTLGTDMTQDVLKLGRQLMGGAGFMKSRMWKMNIDFAVWDTFEGPKKRINTFIGVQTVIDYTRR